MLHRGVLKNSEEKYSSEFFLDNSKPILNKFEQGTFDSFLYFTPQQFTGTGNWSDAARWSGGVVPGASSRVIIDGKATVASAVEVAELQVKPTAQLTIATGNELTVTGDFTLESIERQCCYP